MAHENRKPKDGKTVRCLGPGPEHTFVSPNPCYVRLCWRCRNATEKIMPIQRDMTFAAGNRVTRKKIRGAG
jgi:hypothetical protein